MKTLVPTWLVVGVHSTIPLGSTFIPSGPASRVKLYPAVISGSGSPLGPWLVCAALLVSLKCNKSPSKSLG